MRSLFLGCIDLSFKEDLRSNKKQNFVYLMNDEQIIKIFCKFSTQC